MADRPASSTLSSSTTRTVPAPRRAPEAPSPGLVLIPMRSDREHVLVVVGEADVQTAPALRATIIAMLTAQPPAVLVELAALDFCDLHGLDALHDAAQAALAVGVSLTLHGMSHQLTWLLATYPSPRPAGPPPTDVEPGRSAGASQSKEAALGPTGTYSRPIQPR